MGSLQRVNNVRAGAEVVHGAEARNQSLDLLKELGFPKAVLPLKNLVEGGRVRDTGFVWMKQQAPYEHYFKGTGTRVSYAAEVTGYVEAGRMKKMTGVKSKQMMMWVPITEMSLVNDNTVAGKEKIYFKSAVGIGRSFPVSAFAEDEEEEEEKSEE